MSHRKLDARKCSTSFVFKRYHVNPVGIITRKWDLTQFQNSCPFITGIPYCAYRDWAAYYLLSVSLSRVESTSTSHAYHEVAVGWSTLPNLWNTRGAVASSCGACRITTSRYRGRLLLPRSRFFSIHLVKDVLSACCAGGIYALICRNILYRAHVEWTLRLLIRFNYRSAFSLRHFRVFHDSVKASIQFTNDDHEECDNQNSIWLSAPPYRALGVCTLIYPSLYP